MPLVNCEDSEAVGATTPPSVRKPVGPSGKLGSSAGLMLPVGKKIGQASG